MLREALAGAVALNWPDAVVVQCADYPSAWRAAADGHDLILSDLIMPGASPVVGIGRLREIAPETPILIVTGDEDDATLLALFGLGVSGFAPKTSKSAVIEAAIRLILAGGRYLPPRFIDIAARQAGAATATGARLTARQTDVLKLAQKLERGAANAYIGVIPSFGDRTLAQVSARLAADETLHWTALTQALGEMLPAKPLYFGA